MEKSLNTEQKLPVVRDFFLIHGPPGTDKIVEIIYQLVKKNLCGPYTSRSITSPPQAESLSRGEPSQIEVGDPEQKPGLPAEEVRYRKDIKEKKGELANYSGNWRKPCRRARSKPLENPENPVEIPLKFTPTP